MSQFGELERALARDARRIDPKVATKPVEVRTLADIQRIVQEFAPGVEKDGRPLELSTTMTGEGEDGKVETYRVSTFTQTKSRRTMLIEGMDVIARHQKMIDDSRDNSIPIEVNGVPMSPPTLPIQNMISHVDPMIRRWMGGRRIGLKITWDIQDGYVYLYDIYAHKLTRASKEN